MKKVRKRATNVNIVRQNKMALEELSTWLIYEELNPSEFKQNSTLTTKV